MDAQAVLFHLEQLLQLQPERLDLLARRAAVLQRLKRLPEALADLTKLIERQPELAIVGAAYDGVEAVELADELSPDAVVIDLSGGHRLRDADGRRPWTERGRGLRVVLAQVTR